MPSESDLGKSSNPEQAHNPQPKAPADASPPGDIPAPAEPHPSTLNMNASEPGTKAEAIQAASDLPTKPACMQKVTPSLSPAEQCGGGKGDDEDAEGGEDEDENDEEKTEKVCKRPAAKATKKAPAKKEKGGRGRGRGRGRGGNRSGKAGKPSKAKGKVQDEGKAKLSRKSAAYHRAKKEALEGGVSNEDACAIAQEVACLQIVSLVSQHAL